MSEQPTIFGSPATTTDGTPRIVVCMICPCGHREWKEKGKDENGVYRCPECGEQFVLEE